MLQGTPAFRIVTGLFCLAMLMSGIAHLFRAPPIAEGMAHLGYPLYATTILGTAKILGVGVLLAPGLALLKEWAYAGFAFNLIGATASHVFAGDTFANSAAPAALLLLGATSYLLRAPSQRLAAA